MPTSVSWLSRDSTQFLVSYSQSLMSIYDAATGQEKALINFAHDDSKPASLQQINKLIVSETEKLIIAGTEDNLIRFFDLQSHKQVNTIVAHTDAVTSLLVSKRRLSSSQHSS